MQSPFLFNVIKVMLHHCVDKLLERCFCRIPAEGFLCFCRVAEESLNFRRAEIFRVNFYKTFASGLVVALLVNTFTLEFNFNSGLRKSALAEFPDTVLLACRNDKVIRLFLLKNQPHTFNVILGVPPVAERVKVSKIKTLLVALRNSACGKSDFSCDESLSAAFRLVVKKNSVRAEHSVAFAVVFHNPESVQFCDGIRRARIKRSRLFLCIRQF